MLRLLIQRGRFALIIVSVLVAAMLGFLYHQHRVDELADRLADVSSKLARLEQRITTREQADPWLPVECAYEDGLGQSPQHPCFTSFESLRLAPQKFHGRWIGVRGFYVGGFETSRLSGTLPSGEPILVEMHRPSVWVDGDFPDTWPPKKINVVGQFINGPAGHMSAYFGRLQSAKLVPETESLKPEWLAR